MTKEKRAEITKCLGRFIGLTDHPENSGAYQGAGYVLLPKWKWQPTKSFDHLHMVLEKLTDEQKFNLDYAIGEWFEDEGVESVTHVDPLLMKPEQLAPLVMAVIGGNDGTE